MASVSLQTLVPACLHIRLISVGQDGSPQAPRNPVPSLTWCLSDPVISCGFCNSRWLPITRLPVSSTNAGTGLTLAACWLKPQEDPMALRLPVSPQRPRLLAGPSRTPRNRMKAIYSLTLLFKLILILYVLFSLLTYIVFSNLFFLGIHGTLNHRWLKTVSCPVLLWFLLSEISVCFICLLILTQPH